MNITTRVLTSEPLRTRGVLPPNRMAWREFVHRLGFSERHAYRLYRASAVRRQWGEILDMQWRTQGNGAVKKRLHLDRIAANEEINRINGLRSLGVDSPAY